MNGGSNFLELAANNSKIAHMVDSFELSYYY
jgi:hypothetical protein